MIWKHLLKKLKFIIETLLFVFLSNIFIIAAGLLPDSLQGENVFRGLFYIFECENAILYNSLLLIFIMIVIPLLLYKLRKFFIPFKTLSREKVQPHKCLIAPISPLQKDEPIIDIDRNEISFNDKNIMPFLIKEKNKDNLEKFIEYIQELINGEKISKNWPWQQLLRGIVPHYEIIEKIYLIGSKDKEDSKGSFKQLSDAKALIGMFFNKSDNFIYEVNKEIDFEDDTELRDEMTKIINNLRKTYSERDIVIDVTGGMKPTSIAGAIVTLNTKVTFQYVQTIGKKKEVIGYDVITILKPTME